MTTTTRLDARPSVVILSRGSTFNPAPHEPPYTLPDVGCAWPDGATAEIIFTDSSGGQLATVAGSVAATGITFTPTAPAIMDTVPNGANFELFLTTSDSAPYQIRHGKVVRKEPFLTQAPITTTVQPIAFVDSWPTTGLRSAWIPMAGSTIVNDNSGASLPNGIGSPDVLTGQSDNSIRWLQQLNTNSNRVKITSMDRHGFHLGAFVGILGNSFARARAILCADQYYSTGLGFEIRHTSATLGDLQQQVQLLAVTGPTTVSYLGSAIDFAMSESLTYEWILDYDDETQTLSLYSGEDEATASLLASWQDTGLLIPHGNGYRYVGLGFSTSQLSQGMQITNWQAQDYV